MTRHVRVLAVVMSGAVAVVATGCGPGAGEGLLQAYLGFVGPIVGVGLLLLILLGGLPRA